MTLHYRRSNRWDIQTSDTQRKLSESTTSPVARKSNSPTLHKTKRSSSESSSSGSDSSNSRSPSPTSKFLYGESESKVVEEAPKATNQQAALGAMNRALSSMLDIPIPAAPEKSPEKQKEPKSSLDERIKDFK